MASVAELDFEGASEFVRTAKFAASNEQKLQMYAYFKQASVGDCTSGRPGGFLSAFSAEGLKWFVFLLPFLFLIQEPELFPFAGRSGGHLLEWTVKRPW